MDGFWTDDVENTPDTVKYKAVGKFEPIVLVWCAISDVYITECLPKKVNRRKHHKNDETIF
jgi:hypothetical protein